MNIILGELPDRLAQGRVGGQQRVEAAPRAAGERAQHVFGREAVGEFSEQDVHADHPQRSRQAFSAMSPRRTQVLTEPSGAPRCAAISPWLRPW